MSRKDMINGLLSGILIAAVLIITFFIGFWVGRNDEAFLPHFPGNGQPPEFIGRRFNGHGVLGTIDSLGNNTLVVKDRRSDLQTVLTDQNTQVRRGTKVIKFSDLKKRETVIVLGNPNSTEKAIKADIIRVIYPPMPR